MIFYLIYLSTATDLYTSSDLSDILTKSRSNNESNEITGLLLYHEGSILQILEGDEKTVISLFNKIGKDKRHHNVLKMVTGQSTERTFPDWSMGFKTVTGSEWSEISGYRNLNPSGILNHLNQRDRKIDTMINSYMSVSFGPNYNKQQ